MGKLEARPSSFGGARQPRPCTHNDMNAVLGGTVVVGICFVGINMLSDLLYRFADPRART